VEITSADMEVSSDTRAMIVPPFHHCVEIGEGFHLIFSDRAPVEKVEAFVAAFNELQSAIQDVEAAGRD
jgi:hypothetical protein